MTQINDVLSSSTMSSMYTAAIQSTKAKKEEELKAQQENPAANAINIVSTADIESDKEATAEKKDPVGPAYSVELSEAGILLSEATTKVITDVKAIETDVEVKNAVNKVAETGEKPAMGAPPAGAPPAGAPPTTKASTSVSNTETESSYSSTSLAQYTEAQLQEMLSKGEISQAEYVAEIAQRKIADEEVILEVKKQEIEQPKEAANSDDIINKKEER